MNTKWRKIQTSVDEVSNFWWIKTPQNIHCKFCVSVFRFTPKRNQLKSNSSHELAFEMPGPRNNHFDPNFKHDGNHWHGIPSAPATVSPPQDVRKQLNAVYEFAKQHHHLDLLVKVTNAGIELTRIRLAEKLDSFRQESTHRKRWCSLKEKTSNSTTNRIRLNKNCSRIFKVSIGEFYSVFVVSLRCCCCCLAFISSVKFLPIQLPSICESMKHLNVERTLVAARKSIDGRFDRYSYVSCPHSSWETIESHFIVRWQ